VTTVPQVGLEVTGRGFGVGVGDGMGVGVGVGAELLQETTNRIINPMLINKCDF
jgi:hypothetical protein